MHSSRLVTNHELFCHSRGSAIEGKLTCLLHPPCELRNNGPVSLPASHGETGSRVESQYTMMGRSSCRNIIQTSIYCGILLIVTVSCGDFQDPAPAPSGGVTLISNPSEGELTKPIENQESQPNLADQSRQEVQSTESLFGTDPSSPRRTVKFSWDSSPGALGYKMQLKEISTSILQIIDTGPATKQDIPLKLAEIYSFTVTAYNASGESPPAYPVYFRLD